MHHSTRLMSDDALLSAAQSPDPKGADRTTPAFSAALHSETVLDVRHWTERLFSFTLTRNPGFRFQSGQFTLLGLMVDGRPLLRPYSMASAHYDATLEFLSVKMAHGPLTSQLRHITPGSTVLIGRKPTGTLVQDSLLPGRRLYLFATGTGLAPFLSLIKDPDLYARFDQVVLTHTSRQVSELVHAEHITRELPRHELLGEMVREQLIYYPSVTGEPFRTSGRITGLVESGKMGADLGLPPLDPTTDRAMICGNSALLADMGSLLARRGFREGSLSRPGEFVIEKSFVAR
jgi:ferredoxin/flavodoxin---NADP+ reductase